MSSAEKEQEFLRQARRTLDAAAETLDPVVLGRLRAVRREALAGKPAKKAWPLLPVLTSVAASLVVVVTLLTWQSPEVNTLPALEDLPLLTSTDEMEMLEDIEFYHWLLEAQRNG